MGLFRPNPADAGRRWAAKRRLRRERAATPARPAAQRRSTRQRAPPRRAALGQHTSRHNVSAPRPPGGAAPHDLSTPGRMRGRWRHSVSARHLCAPREQAAPHSRWRSGRLRCTDDDRSRASPARRSRTVPHGGAAPAAPVGRLGSVVRRTLRVRLRIRVRLRLL